MLYGVDTSVYQGPVSWRTARAAGIQFGIPKATEGEDIKDPQFPASWEGLHEAGMPRIAYHFFHDRMDGAKQCDAHHAYVRASGRYAWGDMGALDVEEAGITDRSIALAEITAYIRRFWESIAKPIIIYTNYDTWVNLLGNPSNSYLQACPLWLADLGFPPPRLAPWPTGPAFEQWSWHGHIAGIAGEVDLDRFRGSRVQLDRIRYTVPTIP